MTKDMHPVDAAAAPAAGRGLCLPATLDAEAAEPLRQELLSSLAAGAALTLDGAAVARLSTPCAQVLVAAARTARAHGQGFALRDASDALSESLALLGLDRELAGSEG